MEKGRNKKDKIELNRTSSLSLEEISTLIIGVLIGFLIFSAAASNFSREYVKEYIIVKDISSVFDCLQSISHDVKVNYPIELPYSNIAFDESLGSIKLFKYGSTILTDKISKNNNYDLSPATTPCPISNLIIKNTNKTISFGIYLSHSQKQCADVTFSESPLIIHFFSNRNFLRKQTLNFYKKYYRKMGGILGFDRYKNIDPDIAIYIGTNIQFFFSNINPQNNLPFGHHNGVHSRIMLLVPYYSYNASDSSLESYALEAGTVSCLISNYFSNHGFDVWSLNPSEIKDFKEHYGIPTKPKVLVLILINDTSYNINYEELAKVLLKMDPKKW